MYFLVWLIIVCFTVCDLQISVKQPFISQTGEYIISHYTIKYKKTPFSIDHFQNK